MDSPELTTDDLSFPSRRRRGRMIAVVAAVAVLVTGVGVVLVGTGSDTLSTDVEAVDTTTTVSAVTTSPVFVNAAGSTTPPTTVPATVATLPATPDTATPDTTAPETTVAPTTLPVVTTPDAIAQQQVQPIAPPSDVRSKEAYVQLGSIVIPKLGINEPLLEGIRLSTLDQGPGHWPGTAMPGDVGNVVVAGHRTSHGATFRYIDTLVAGDVVQFNTSAGLTSYTVTSTEIVQPDAVWIVDQTATPTATLFACHPPGSTRQRIVVHLELS